MTCSCRRTERLEGSVGVVALGAGSGERLGAGAKAFVTVAGKPMLLWALEAMLGSAAVGSVVVVVPKADITRASELVRTLDDGRVRAVVAGGDTRQDSASIGLSALGERHPLVALGDVARPLLPSEIIDRMVAQLNAARDSGAVGVVPTVPLFDTIRTAGPDGVSAGTVPRSTLRSTQSPQLFCRPCLVEVFRRCAQDGITGTDDAELAERRGERVLLADGAARNFKITVAADLMLAESLVASGAVTASR